MAKCVECETGKLKIMGTAGFGDMIEVECQNPECGEGQGLKGLFVNFYDIII
jgi:hypothetical protein